jgi:AcrR family transcriptional regulator
MTPVPSRPARRRDALSKERILEAAIAILDADGNSNGPETLTLRALMTRLSTGSGAIYHHVGTMDELRAAAADDVLRRSFEALAPEADPVDALRDIGAAIFDTINAHAWVGAQLTRNPLQPAVLRLWKTIGVQLQRKGLDGDRLLNAGSTLASFILGSASQHRLSSQPHAHETDRAAGLAHIAEQWKSLDPDPLVNDIATRLREHDDRGQFLAGIDIILAGIPHAGH